MSELEKELKKEYRRSYKKAISIGVTMLLIVFGTYATNHFSHSSSELSAQPLAKTPLAEISNDSAIFSLITEPDQGITPIINAIASANTSVDLVMYELTDADIEKALAADASRGVSVRVLLNSGYYGKPDTPNINQSAYDFLKSKGVSVKWTSGTFALTHEKSMVIDNSTGYIMTMNFTPQYYAADREFTVVDTNSADVSAMEESFNSDWAYASKGVKGENGGSDLIWSPGSENSLVALINQATTSLRIYNEEMNDTNIVRALSQASKRGVNVEVVMTDSKSWHKNFDILKTAGVFVRTFDPKAALYIHAKAIVVDDTDAFVGSENFSATSLNSNRELGVLVHQQSIIDSVTRTFDLDFQQARSY